MYLWIIFDAVVIAIFVICISMAMKKGFIKASSTILSIVLTFLLMFLFQDTISTYIKNSDMGLAIQQRVTSAITKDVEEQNPQMSDSELSKSIGLPKFIMNIIPNVSDKIENAKNQIVQKTSENITASLINVLSIIILYIIIRLFLFILIKLLDNLFKLPGLKTVNKLSGAVIGIINALFVVYILCALLIWFVPNDSSEMIKIAISQTMITKYFYNNNLLLKIFL